MNAYQLRLADGQSWCLLASDGTSVWLEKFASIMGLSKGCGTRSRRLIFVRRGELKADGARRVNLRRAKLSLHLPVDGWMHRALGKVNLLSHPDADDIVCELSLHRDRKLQYLMMHNALLPIFEQAVERGGLPFHAALVERDGKGILLCAPSGTGKSTCARRIPRPWRALADDDILVVRTGPGRYAAHPFPTWSEYTTRRSRRTWRIEGPAPLCAVFFLEQSPLDLAALVRPKEASVLACHHPSQTLMLAARLELPATHHGEARLRFCRNVCELVKSIPAFTLKVSLRGQFWREIERVLGWS